MDTQNTNIVLIGPVGAGKSTQGKLIAKALNKQLVSLDRIADDYYKASGFGASQFQKAVREKGFWLHIAFGGRLSLMRRSKL